MWQNLLQDEAGVGATGAGGIIVDHARLIRTEHPLARRADGLRCARDDVGDRRNGAVPRQHEGVAGLVALGKTVIDQAGLRRRGRTRICAAKSSQLRRETHVGIGDGIGNGGGVDHAEGGNRGSLIGAEARLEKIGHGDGRDDQDHRDNEEQLNQGESSVAPHEHPTSKLFRRRTRPQRGWAGKESFERK